jgi:hypothetical protein
MPKNFSSCLMSQLGNQDIFGSLLATLCMRDVLLRVQKIRSVETMHESIQTFSVTN